MMCGGDKIITPIWVILPHDRDGEWTGLGHTIILGPWLLLPTPLGTSLTLPTCFFFFIALDDPPWVPVTLVSSESIREIYPEVVHDVAGSGWVISCTAARASAWAASHLAVEGKPISLIPWEGTWPVEHGIELTVSLTEPVKEGGIEPVWARRFHTAESSVYTGIGTSYTSFPSYSALFHPHN